MPIQALVRSGGLVSMATGLLFAIGGILAAVMPEGGLSSPLVPLVYYMGLVLSTLAFMGIYFPQAGETGRMGLGAFLLAFLGAVLYSAPIYTLVAGTSGVQEWHSIWAFAMGNVLSLGGTIFLLGMLLLGIVSGRAAVFPRWSGILLAAGAALWFLAFWGLSFLLMPANLVTAVGMFWMGWSLYASARLEGIPA